MLTSQVIFLKLQKGDPEAIHGNHIHGFFFKKILATVNPCLADCLHSPDSEKPFSISYMYREGQIYWFRITSWMDEIAQAVFLFFQKHVEIHLNQCVFKVMKTSTDRNESEWADRSEIDDFMNQAISTSKETFWLLHFSPTSFKTGDSHLPLPVPELILNSIIKQLPLKMKKDTFVDLSLLKHLIQLKEYNIFSVYNRKNQGSIASFNGKTRWQISKKASQEEKQAIWMMFNFSFYSGIGVKTTQGMGMCRIIE